MRDNIGLYKAKIYDGKEWLFGVPIINKLGTFICYENNPHFCSQYNYMEIQEIAKVDSETVCEHTGLMDKNKTAIFENDIVKASVLSKYGALDILDVTGVVGYGSGAFWIKVSETEQYLLMESGGSTNIEVIGNIFDDPELLEVES